MSKLETKIPQTEGFGHKGIWEEAGIVPLSPLSEPLLKSGFHETPCSSSPDPGCVLRPA